MRLRLIALLLLMAFTTICCQAKEYSSDDFANFVETAYGLGASPHDDPQTALGKPTVWYKEYGTYGRTFASSMVAAPFNKDPYGNKVIVTVEEDGVLIVRFNKPIEDDPLNWYGKDFIVFSNAAFNGGPGYVEPNTDMEQHWINDNADGRWEQMIVSVSQHLNGPWYEYENGPYADDFAPAQAFAWDYINHTWGAELDFTKPVNATVEQFKGLSTAAAIDLYKGSAGGTAFDLSGFDLPTNANGCKWIKYIKITGYYDGEIDAFARVGHAIAPVTAAEAKLITNGESVILENHIVSAGTSELGDCCYVQSADGFSGIKLTGRIIERGKLVTVYGVMNTSNNEREVRVTALEILGDDTAKPKGMSCKSVGGIDLIVNGATVQKGVAEATGPNNIGLLVRIWGRAGSISEQDGAFTVDDGSGRAIKCKAPADPSFTFPQDRAFVKISGISSLEPDGQGGLVSIVRLRDQNDLQ